MCMCTYTFINVHMCVRVRARTQNSRISGWRPIRSGYSKTECLLQCVAFHSVLQCVAVGSETECVLQCAAFHSVSQCVAVGSED